MTIARCSRHKDVKPFPLGCSTCVRIQLEAQIVKKTVMALLGAGFSLNVNNGGDGPELKQASRVANEVLAVMMETDDEHLEVFSDTGSRMIEVGWVSFVYGNDGYDAIHDHTSNLDAVLADVHAYARRMSGG